ncbi:hypothetical protein F8388_026639 [Cannabis sativa]|uniref:S-protein homolog n=1 Tax=Cannabis sativa TaxID=3483 RepID=A0A7J6ECB4_CANSA|nr:hypothetical protein F8388_026639 [Cannabis sativa]
MINGQDSPDGGNLTVHCRSEDDDLGIHVYFIQISHAPLFSIVALNGPNSDIYYFFNIYDCYRDDQKCIKCKHYDWK